MGFLGLQFLRLRFWTCDEDFSPDRPKKILSGDDRAVFERVIHGDLWEVGTGYWVCIL